MSIRRLNPTAIRPSAFRRPSSAQYRYRCRKTKSFRHLIAKNIPSNVLFQASREGGLKAEGQTAVGFSLRISIFAQNEECGAAYGLHIKANRPTEQVSRAVCIEREAQAIPLFCDVGNQGQVPCALESGGNQSLMAGAGAAGAARNDLAAIRYELAQLVNRFIVYAGCLLDAEHTDLASRLAELIRWALAPYWWRHG